MLHRLFRPHPESQAILLEFNPLGGPGIRPTYDRPAILPGTADAIHLYPRAVLALRRPPCVHRPFPLLPPLLPPCPPSPPRCFFSFLLCPRPGYSLAMLKRRRKTALFFFYISVFWASPRHLRPLFTWPYGCPYLPSPTPFLVTCAWGLATTALPRASSSNERLFSPPIPLSRGDGPKCTAVRSHPPRIITKPSYLTQHSGRTLANASRVLDRPPPCDPQPSLADTRPCSA